MATKKAKTETETESLLPGPEADEAEETANAQTQADSDVVADANDSVPSANETAHDVESQSQTAQEVEDSGESEETKALELESQSQTETQSSGTNETEESHETHQPIIYAGVLLVRNKTSKPLCLSPIQLGIYATLTIQSGEIVALPHKYARSLIGQQLFEEVEGQLYVQPCADCKSTSNGEI